MKITTATFTVLLILTGCVSQPNWGTEVGGLSCRLQTLDTSPLLAIAIRNQSDVPVSLPTLNDGVPRLTITIQEEPEVLSPPSFGGAVPTKRIISPGDTYTFTLIDAYLLFYGKPNDNGWAPFKPEEKTYHIEATVHTDAGDLVAPPFPLEMKDKWTAEQSAALLRFEGAPSKRR
jgi:hypothetical protein